MSTTADLSALSAVEAWGYFGTVEADALTALRARMGETYQDATAYPDAAIKAAVTEAVAYFEGATGRFFVKRTGTLDVDGTGTSTLYLPFPVVSTNQDSGAEVGITVGEDTTELDTDSYRVHDGTGLPGRDPRDNPLIERVAPSTSSVQFVSYPPGYGGTTAWPAGSRNIHVDATWGYLDESGETPDLVQEAVALLTIRATIPNDEPDELDELHRGAIQAESTRDRSISYGQRAQGGGLTTDPTIDRLIQHFKAPNRVRRNQPPNRRRVTSRTQLLRSFTRNQGGS